jgi:hypothetical protein
MGHNKFKKPATEEIQNIAPGSQKVPAAKIPVGVIKLRDKKQIEAAQLLVEGGMTDEQIAAKVKVGRRTLSKWKLKPQFVAYLDELKKVFAERFLREGLAKRENRIAKLSAMVSKTEKVINERAHAAVLPGSNLANVPGAETGLIVMTYKGLSKTAVAEVDTPTVKMMAALLDQISVEVGDKVTKGEVKINDAIGERMERAQARARRALEQEGRTVAPMESSQIN